MSLRLMKTQPDGLYLLLRPWCGAPCVCVCVCVCVSVPMSVRVCVFYGYRPVCINLPQGHQELALTYQAAAPAPTPPSHAMDHVDGGR